MRKLIILACASGFLAGCGSEEVVVNPVNDSNLEVSNLGAGEASLVADSFFFADRLGGGPEDVYERNIVSKKYRNRSNQDIVLPNSSGVYDFTADDDAIIVMPYELDESSLNKVQTDENGNLIIGKGKWVLTPNRNSKAKDKAGLEEAYIEYDKSSVALSISTEEFATSSGNRVLVKASLHASDSDDSPLNNFSNAQVTVTEYLDGAKTNNQSSGKLNDDGENGDDIASDGIYSGYIDLTQAGKHALQVRYTGRLNDEPISRSTVVRSFVSSTRIKATNNVVTATNGLIGETPLEEGRFGISIGVNSVKGDIPDIVNTYAEVWGKNSAGDDVVVGWTGGLIVPSEESDGISLPMSFHSGWLAMDDYHAPYTLRQLEVFDIDNHDQILVDYQDIQLDDLFLQNTFLKGELGASKTPTMDMERGVHPDVLNGTEFKGSRFGSDRVVMSLHGFCDRAKSLNNFSSTIRNKAYEYPGSNRGESATRYASDVARHINFRAGKIRGIVAHSHGGMVGATLLNNYSYLFTDNARSRPPNVVAMGTPFWGTGLLEGRLPGFIEGALIDLFESVSGCNIPAELYPSRNSSWSRSIGWRAKNQVRAYFTTHTRPPRFESRNCRSSLSSQIRGSDDGVLAPSNGLGFADGGNVDYHYSGYCHLPGMGQGDQWQHPGFKSYVNNIFHQNVERWQPF